MIPNDLRTLAARQHGVVTRQQILQAGISRRIVDRLIAQRTLVPVHAGVYALAGSPNTARRMVMAAVLAIGREGVASHRAAAYLLQLGDLDCTVEVSTLHSRRPKLPQGLRVHR